MSDHRLHERCSRRYSSEFLVETIRNQLEPIAPGEKRSRALCSASSSIPLYSPSYSFLLVPQKPCLTSSNQWHKCAKKSHIYLSRRSYYNGSLRPTYMSSLRLCPWINHHRDNQDQGVEKVSSLKGKVLAQKKIRGTSTKVMQKSLSVMVGSSHKREMIWKREQECYLQVWVLPGVVGHNRRCGKLFPLAFNSLF